MYNIIFFKGILETMDYFTDKCTEALSLLGADTYIIDAGDPSTYNGEDFRRFMERENKAVFLWNQIGLNMTVDGNNLWEKYGVPIYDSIQDHPRNFPDTLTSPPGDFHALVLDNNHAAFIREFYPAIRDIRFFPNGGACEGQMIPYDKRSIPVLYCGSVQKAVSGFPMLSIFADQGKMYYNQTIGLMISDPSLTTEQAVSRVIDGCGFSPDEYHRLFFATSVQIDMYVRRYFKLSFMHALEKKRIPVAVYGDHWDDGFSEPISIHTRISSRRCNELASDARISLNFMPWYKDGSSERVFNNMLGGSLCISDRSRYLSDHYRDGEDIVFFDLKDPDGFADKVSYYLSDMEKAAEIAANGARKAAENDSWYCRMKTFLSFLEEEK